MTDSRGIDTRLIHAGEQEPRIEGAAILPIFQSTVFETRDAGSYDAIRYPRLNNLPNQRVLGAKLSSLEGGEAGVVTASGMAAITTTLLTLLQGGGHLLAQDSLYGGSYGFIKEGLSGFGMNYNLVDARDIASWDARVRPETKAIYTEAITNPLMEVADHLAIVAFARERGLVSIIDSTFATPINFRPLEIGYDVVVHSATKYLNGHSDLVAGAVIGSRELVDGITHQLNHLGGSLDPHACFLLHRGLKTLGLRVRRQNETAQTIAEFLETAPGVARVNYPGLESDEKSAHAREYFGGFGGVLSFELEDGASAADRMIGRMKLAVPGPSLGGVETLVTRPATTSHLGMSPQERQRMGVADGLVRLSVGLEDADDLIDDLRLAIEAGD